MHFLMFIGGCVFMEILDSCISRTYQNAKKANAEIERLKRNQELIKQLVFQYINEMEMDGTIQINRDDCYSDCTIAPSIQMPYQVPNMNVGINMQQPVM